MQKLIAKGRVRPGDYKNLRLHRVADDENLALLNASSKLSTGREFLLALHGLGRAAAGRWMLACRADIDVRATPDLHATFLAPRRSA